MSLQKQTTTSCKCAEQQFITAELKYFVKVTKQNHLEWTKSAMPQTNETLRVGTIALVINGMD